MRAREDREVAWPADQVERWPIDRLIPYAKNSRTHSEAQIAQLAASMKEWGWTNPVLERRGAGHGPSTPPRRSGPACGRPRTACYIRRRRRPGRSRHRSGWPVAPRCRGPSVGDGSPGARCAASLPSSPRPDRRTIRTPCAWRARPREVHNVVARAILITGPQLERPRHGVNPPAFRAIATALHAEFGKPNQTCIIPVLPNAGYQAAAEERWVHDGTAVSAIFRDTTLQAFEGCLFGPATGWCGLRGQLLVRIGPPDGGADPCAVARHYNLPVAAAPSGTPR